MRRILSHQHFNTLDVTEQLELLIGQSGLQDENKWVCPTMRSSKTFQADERCNCLHIYMNIVQVCYKHTDSFYSVIYLFTSLIHFSLRLLRFVPHCLLHVLSPGINKGLSDLKVAPQSDRSCLITSVTSTQSQTFNLYVNGSYLTRTQSAGNEQFAQPIGKLVTGNIPVTRVTISLLEK